MVTRRIAISASVLALALVGAPAVSAHAPRVAYLRGRTVYVRDIESNGLPVRGSHPLRVCRVPGTGRFGEIALSNDGGRVAFSTSWYTTRTGEGGCDLWVAEARAGATPRHVAKGAAPTFSPDGRRLAYETQGGRWQQDVRVLDLATGKSRLLWAKGSSPHWSADGREIALVDESPNEFTANIAVVDAATGKVRFSGSAINGMCPFVSPDGRYVAYNPHMSRPKLSPEIVDRASGKVRGPDTAGSGEPVLGWSPDGRWMLWTRWEVNPENDGAYLWTEVWASSPDGRRSRRICMGGPGAFAPDSRHILAVRCTKRDPDPPGDLILADLSGRRIAVVAESVDGFDVSGQPAPKPAYLPRIIDLMGSVGWPGDAKGVKAWHEMGLTWGRDSVGPGRASPTAPLLLDRSGPGNVDLPAAILTNNREGIRSVLLLAYSYPWNTETGDAFSAPKDVSVWEEYVEAAVSKYSRPPYNVRYFQVWNEAAGRILSAPQATFWHGPGYPKEPYASAMEDYVDRVHIPAARIIRRHGCRVVYGGWPDQGGIDQYEQWLGYHDLAKWVDYLDIHYLGIGEMERLYREYVATGVCRGVWQTEIGDACCKDATYLARFYFAMARWALERGWDRPDKYVAMVYHWSGPEDFRLTQWNNPDLYTKSGRSLIALSRTLDRPLAPYRAKIAVAPEGAATAIWSGGKTVLQVSAANAGSHTVTIADNVWCPKPMLVDAVTGEPGPALTVKEGEKAWSATFDVPAASAPALYYLVIKSEAEKGE